MPPSDLDLARLCQSLYDNEPIFDYVGGIDEVAFALKSYPDCTAVLFEGSHDLEDWKNDFDALMIHPPGVNGAGVHAGFYTGLASVLTQIETRLSKSKPVYCVGHSFGAGRAHIFGAMLAVLGYDIVVVAFGSPRPGDEKLSAILAPFPNRSYWNYDDEWDHDLVGDVPVAITPLFRFVQPRERILINVPPAIDDPWGNIMGWHHLNNYIQGIQHG